MATKVYYLSDWEINFFEFLIKQNNKFLQKMKGQKVFISEDTSNSKPFAKFSIDGKRLQIYKQSTVSFDQSSASDLGFYEIDFDSSHHYLGFTFEDTEVFMHSTFDFDDIFKVNGIRIYLAK